MRAVGPLRDLAPGDIDLCVRPEEQEAAKAVLWGPGRLGTAVTDLKHELQRLKDYYKDDGTVVKFEDDSPQPMPKGKAKTKAQAKAN